MDGNAAILDGNGDGTAFGPVAVRIFAQLAESSSIADVSSQAIGAVTPHDGHRRRSNQSGRLHANPPDPPQNHPTFNIGNAVPGVPHIAAANVAAAAAGRPSGLHVPCAPACPEPGRRGSAGAPKIEELERELDNGSGFRESEFSTVPDGRAMPSLFTTRNLRPRLFPVIYVASAANTQKYPSASYPIISGLAPSTKEISLP